MQPSAAFCAPLRVQQPTPAVQRRPLHPLPFASPELGGAVKRTVEHHSPKVHHREIKIVREEIFEGDEERAMQEMGYHLGGAAATPATSSPKHYMTTSPNHGGGHHHQVHVTTTTRIEVAGARAKKKGKKCTQMVVPP
jgi:hypothetical protein